MKDSPDVTDENNNFKNILDALDSEPGYYHQVIRSMLNPGHETELVYWLRNFGLIPNVQICKNAQNNQDCNKVMEWLPVKTIDYYQWKCKNCTEKMGIRESSIFQDVKCNFKNCLRIILGWCKGYDIDTIANSLGVRKQTVRVLYGIVAATARKHLKSQELSKKIGGSGVIVLVDTYPEGCMNNTNQANRPILCIAEVKEIPPNYHFEALSRYSRTNQDQIRLNKEHCLRVIQEVVLPSSIIITRQQSNLLSYQDLEILKPLYPTIITVEELERHNTLSQNVFVNVEVIWRLALRVCEEAQFVSYEEVPNLLVSHMWSRRFGGEAFEVLLNRLSDLQ